ncbi:hypothetical protein ABVK25_006976 [Lepraria finkii]|uniref:Uncharacterized protein n=1 Tax=Lepraria finkii TaxID=1340010 RepID=A0ABR4B4D9_9LECA
MSTASLLLQAPPAAMSTSVDTSKKTTPASSRDRSQSHSQTPLSSFGSPSEDKPAENLLTPADPKIIDALNKAFPEEVQRAGKLIDSNGDEFEIPDFTVSDIRAAIPAHCLERSTSRSLAYVARDLLYLAVTWLACHKFITSEYIPSPFLRGIGWVLYTFLEGCIGTGLWVLAHECGHGAFSPSKTVNDTVGFFCHTALLVPYFAWKITHGMHHAHTGHMQKDMVFVPKTRHQYASKLGKLTHEISELCEETPIVTAVTLIGQQLLGWILYITTNVTGTDYYTGRKDGRGIGKKSGFFGGVNHFQPSTPLINQKDEKLIVYSDLGLAFMAGLLYYVGANFGWWNLTVWYFIPYLWVNHWLVAITYLQHTDPSLPHYEDGAWNFQRGAAATIDRDLGLIGTYLMHGIISTHVLHHFVSTIPFYHADEASDAIKPVLGKHYRQKIGGFWYFVGQMWMAARECQWVEPCPDVEGEGKMSFSTRTATTAVFLQRSSRSPR